LPPWLKSPKYAVNLGRQPRGDGRCPTRTTYPNVLVLGCSTRQMPGGRLRLTLRSLGEGSFTFFRRAAGRLDAAGFRVRGLFFAIVIPPRVSAGRENRTRGGGR
jgi:hypothetical protein